MRILIAEHEKKVPNFIGKASCKAGYAVEEAHEGNAALDLDANESHDATVRAHTMQGVVYMLKLL